MHPRDIPASPDRRTVIKWMLTAAAVVPTVNDGVLNAAPASPAPSQGYGPIPTASASTEPVTCGR